jgi:hypothetical protein
MCTQALLCSEGLIFPRFRGAEMLSPVEHVTRCQSGEPRETWWAFWAGAESRSPSALRSDVYAAPREPVSFLDI